jgi:hypothetical protein
MWERVQKILGDGGQPGGFCSILWVRYWEYFLFLREAFCFCELGKMEIYMLNFSLMLLFGSLI